MSQQHASASKRWIYADNCTCSHTEIEVVDRTFHSAHSRYIDSRPASPRADSITQRPWQGSHLSTNFKSLVRLDLEEDPRQKRESNPGLPLSRRTPYHKTEEAGKTFETVHQSQDFDSPTRKPQEHKNVADLFFLP